MWFIVQLLLEVNLNAVAWNPDTSFVAAGMSGDSSGQSCVSIWNGFVAASPRHPVIRLAIQLFLESHSGWSPSSLSTVWEAARRTCSERPGICRVGRDQDEFSSHLLGKAFSDITWGQGDTTDDDLIYGSYVSPFADSRSLILLVSTNMDDGFSSDMQVF